jgi:Flp pilus assembly protein CpaB
MTLNYRTRNIVIAAVLAAAAVLLTVLYVSSSKKHDENKTEAVTVYVTTKSYPLGTAGSKVAGSLKPVSVTRDTMTTEAVTSPSQIRNLYTIEPLYAGEQLTLKRFAPPTEQGVRAKLTGTERAFQLSGDTNQLLAGTLVPGDRVDVLVNLKNPKDQEDVRSFVALRGLRVLQTDKGKAGAKIDTDNNSSTGEHAVILAVTDEQAQRLQYAVLNCGGTDCWRLSLRPVKKPKDSTPTTAVFATVVNGGAK